MFNIKIRLRIKKSGSDQLKLIAVSQRVDYLQDRGEVRESIDQNLSSFLLANELCPILISNKLFSNNLINSLIQIGANDGLRFDILNKYIKT